MKPSWLSLFVLALVATGCSRPAPAARQYELSGQIQAIAPERNEVTIKHGDIKGFMPGMTMPFTVKDGSLLAGKAPGDLVTATLVVEEVDAHLSTLTRTGHEDLPNPAQAPDGAAVLREGDPVADATLVDQNGKARAFSSFKGQRVAVTFVYARCPIPDFCPLMNRHFAAVQKSIKSRPELADVRLLTVTMDPEYDTPAVLAPLARALDADPAVWSFATGDPEAVKTFGSQFGIYVEKDAQDPAQLTHNLRTAIVDPAGRLVKIESGNSWTPAELVADLEKTPAPQR
jgi:protein SCO1